MARSDARLGVSPRLFPAERVAECFKDVLRDRFGVMKKASIV